MRYLGLDLGSKTLGVALSDMTGLLASSYTIIRHNEEYDRLILEVKKIVEEKRIGLPNNRLIDKLLVDKFERGNLNQNIIHVRGITRFK